MIRRITNKILPEIRECQSRPLNLVYPSLFGKKSYQGTRYAFLLVIRVDGLSAVQSKVKICSLYS